MIGTALRTGRAGLARAYHRIVDGESEELQRVPPDERVEVQIVACIPDGDELVVRVLCITRDGGEAPGLTASVTDMRGNPMQSQGTVLGSTRFAEEGARPRWETVIAVRMPCSSAPARIWVSDASGSLHEGVRCLNRRRLRLLLHQWNRASANAWDSPSYGRWFAMHRAGGEELARQSQATFAWEPLISIVVPLFNTPVGFFREMASSVACQSYGNWELLLVNASPSNVELAAEVAGCSGSDARIRVIALDANKGIVGNTNAGIEAARGDFIAFLDHDDLIEPDALYRYVAAINDHPACDMLYCDEDSYSPGGRFLHPHFKPDFNRDLLYSHNYITHFLMVRASVVRAVGASPDYVEGAQDYDLTLRAAEVAREVVHVPCVLYHWRVHAQSTSANAESKAYAQAAGKRALEDHFRRRGINAAISNDADAFTYVESYDLDAQPLVSIVIPSKDHIDVLAPCIDSILNAAMYQNYEIVIVENNSEQPATFEFYAQAEQDPRVRVVRFEGAFNYSKVINFGVGRAQGEYLLLLNNDTQVITPDFIERMIGYFAREEVGVVGAKLLHYDETVQHAGVVVGPFDEPWHVFMDAPDAYRGYMGRANLTQDYLAVTGACQMVSRSVFEELGGYDESYAVAYNDVDFCLRVRESGRLVVYDPHVKLYHREFTSRGRDVAQEELVRFHREKALLHERWARYFVEGDPYYNPNLERDSLFFALGS